MVKLESIELIVTGKFIVKISVADEAQAPIHGA